MPVAAMAQSTEAAMSARQGRFEEAATVAAFFQGREDAAGGARRRGAGR